ncbi:hypothetical protein PIB30_017043 [Stylosanthes scabra]|uniref:Uncharacterized protein n=1 Tax=Stylosanthes scabra TaxID=79078 RepID=A0ABU6R7S3_9FABA|nr:hypothetical protein [Stylosanthes scabra]
MEALEKLNVAEKDNNNMKTNVNILEEDLKKRDAKIADLEERLIEPVALRKEAEENKHNYRFEMFAKGFNKTASQVKFFYPENVYSFDAL